MKRSLYSPFWPRTTGASTLKAVPAGSSRIRRDDLLAGLGGDRPVALRAVPLADPGEQDAEVVVDLGDRPDGRPGVPPAGLLLDRDRGGEPVDPVDLGLGHLAQELAGVAREALDVPPLALGIERVERQRALARARDAGQADQPPPRQVSETSRRLCSRAPRITMSDVAIPGKPSLQWPSGKTPPKETTIHVSGGGVHGGERDHGKWRGNDGIRRSNHGDGTTEYGDLTTEYTEYTETCK